MVTTVVKTFRLTFEDDARLTELCRAHGVGLREMVEYLCLTGIPQGTDVAGMVRKHQRDQQVSAKGADLEEKERMRERLRAIREDEREKIRLERENEAREERLARIRGTEKPKVEQEDWMKDMLGEE